MKDIGIPQPWGGSQKWEIVEWAAECPVVRRYRVPGGWLYQVSMDDLTAVGLAASEDSRIADEIRTRMSWFPPTFVPYAAEPGQ